MQDSTKITVVPEQVPSTTFAPQPELPPNAPKFAPIKHPLRFAIHGRKHMIKELKAMVAKDDTIPAHYQDMIKNELDLIKTNSAQVDLHVVDHADGGISIQMHVKPIQLG